MLRGKGVLLGLAVILLGSLLLAGNSFRFHHSNGDQRLFVAMAMKMEKTGLSEYNIYRIGLRRDGDFIDFHLLPEGKGDLLHHLVQAGVPAYDQPLLHGPPLFSAIVTMSHKAFASGKPYLVLSRDRYQEGSTGFSERFSAQFYCCIVPIVFGLLLLVAGFGLGRVLAGPVEGLITALVLAVSPVFIQSSQRIWSDTTLAFFICAAFLSFWRFAKDGRLLWLLPGAVATAAALLIKNTALFLGPALLVAFFLTPETGIPRTVRPYLGLAAFGLAVLIMTAPWYVMVYREFGTPFFNPRQPGISNANAWFSFITARPWYTYLVTIPYQNPVLLLGFAEILRSLRRLKERTSLVLGVWYLSNLVLLTWIVERTEELGPDERYMLPAYAPLALLSAMMLVRIARALRPRWGLRAATVACGTILLVSAAWSLRIALMTLSSDLIPIPF